MARSPLALAALLAMPVAARAQAKEEGATKRGVVHIVFLRDKNGKPAKAETEKVLDEVNAIYQKLGVSARAVVADKSVLGAKVGDPFTFAETSSVALIGPVAEIKSLLAKKDPERAYFLDDWTGGETPELSENRLLTLGNKTHRGGGRYIAVDGVSGVGSYQAVLSKSRSSIKTSPPWTWAQTAAFIVVHGSGHNADLDHDLEHAEYGGIMTDGKVVDEVLPAAEASYAAMTSPAKNPKLIGYLKARYK